jgi:hypothetical protein
MNVPDHPLIEEYLSRLDQASAGLPSEARAELRSDITEHLSSGLGERPTDADVRNLLQQLGSPQDIASAAMADVDPPLSAPLPPPGVPLPGPSASESRFGVGAPPLPPPVAPAGTPSVWGPVEIIAVVGLTAGMFVVPILGPIVGLVMAWISPSWTRREKAIATGLTALPLIAVIVLAAGLLAVSSTSGSSSGSSIAPGPTVSAIPASSAPTYSPTGVTP